MSYYSAKSKKRFTNQKKYGKSVGNSLSFDRGFRPLYDTLTVEDFHYENRIDQLFDYLFYFYKQKDFYLDYMEQGYKDPCLNFCLSKSGYFKSDMHKDIILNNWEDIMLNAFNKFFRKSIHLFDPAHGVRFATFFNNTFPICFYYEFLEYIRDWRLERNKLKSEIFLNIDDYQNESYDSIDTIPNIGIEFILKLKQVK